MSIPTSWPFTQKAGLLRDFYRSSCFTQKYACLGLTALCSGTAATAAAAAAAAAAATSAAATAATATATAPAPTTTTTTTTTNTTLASCDLMATVKTHGDQEIGGSVGA
eukprot:gene25837-biopygen16530